MRVFLSALGILTLTLFSAGCGDGGGGTGGSTGGTGGGAATGGATSSTTTTTTSNGTTMGTSSGCFGAETNLGSGACVPTSSLCHAGTNSCLAQKEFKDLWAFDLRISQLTITKPDALTAAKDPVVAGVLSKAILPNLPTCQLDGEDTFSWILSYNLFTSKLKIGSGAWHQSPLGPYAWASGEVDGGFGTKLSVAPQWMDMAWGSDCHISSSSASGPMAFQIFLGSANDYLLLPLSISQVDASLTDNHACIGRYAADTLDPGAMCLPARFEEAGTLSGVIPLQTAEQVLVASLQETLCSLLTGTQVQGADGKNHCATDANGDVTDKGDACSTTLGDATPDCADALHFEATFAASGIDLQDP